MRTLFSKHNSQKGQSLTEMAISMVILLILIAGIFDVGRAIFTFMSLRDAAQEGAAFASYIFQPTEDEAKQIKDNTLTLRQVRDDRCGQIVDRTKLSVSDVKVNSVNVLINGKDCLDNSTYPMTITSDACAGHEARVTVALDLPITTPFIGMFIGSQTISLRATATDTILRPYCK